MKKNRAIRSHQKILWLTLALVFPLFSCQKLDKDGGYYDEKTKTYKYVNVAKRGVEKSTLRVFSPTPGKPQNIQGVVTRIDDDAKSIWLKIQDRHPYQIIAERLSGGNRNDKTRELRIQLNYVSPLGSITHRGKFRKRWKDYTIGRLQELLLNKPVFVEIDYEEIARKLWGTVSIVIETKKGDRIRNVNLWMVQQGLSYYFIDRGTPQDDQKYRNAQKVAQKYSNGIWKH